MLQLFLDLYIAWIVVGMILSIKILIINRTGGKTCSSMFFDDENFALEQLVRLALAFVSMEYSVMILSYSTADSVVTYSQNGLHFMYFTGFHATDFVHIWISRNLILMEDTISKLKFRLDILNCEFRS